jgi:hypothetical protein
MEIKIGTIQCDDNGGPEITWTRKDGPYFGVAYECFGLFVGYCPWEFLIVAFDNVQHTFTVYISSDAPNGVRGPSTRAGKMAVDLSRMLRSFAHGGRLE